MENIKFVISIPNYGDVYDYCYQDLKQFENVDLIKDIKFKNNFEKKCYYKHMNSKFPFKFIWNYRYYENKFYKNDKIIFILYISNINMYDYGLIKHMRKKYKNSKYVLFLNDLISKKFNDNNFKKVFNLFDNVVTFDKRESEKYQIQYYPLVYSRLKIKRPIINYDVYFCGKAKDRLEEIVKCYMYLNNLGFNCLFIINTNDDINVLSKKYPGIIFTNKIISYRENLNNLLESRCMLEIMQENGDGYTLRICEAVAYNKKIITNNKFIIQSEFYDENMIQVFDDVSDIDIDFIKGDNKKYMDSDYFSPKKFIEKLTNYYN